MRRDARRTSGAPTRFAPGSSTRASLWRTAPRGRPGAARDRTLVGEPSRLADGGELHESGAVVVRGAEIDLVAPDVEGLHRIERLHQTLACGIGPGAAYRLNENLRADVRLQRRERIVLLAERFLYRRLVFPDYRNGGPGVRRHDLCNHDARSLVTELGCERARPDEGSTGELRGRPRIFRRLDEIAGRLVEG